MARLVEELTVEQIAQFPHYVDKWIKVGLQTGPMDKELVKAAITDLYTIGGLNPPQHIVWLSSPMELTMAAYMLHVLGQQPEDPGLGPTTIRRQALKSFAKLLHRQVGSNPLNEVTGHVRMPVCNTVVNPVWSLVTDQVRGLQVNQMHHNVLSRLIEQAGAGDLSVWDRVWGQITAPLFNAVWDQVADQIMEQIRDQTRDQIRGKIREYVRKQVHGRVTMQISNQIREQTSALAYNEVRNGVMQALITRLFWQVPVQTWRQIEELATDPTKKQMLDEVGGSAARKIYDAVWEEADAKVAQLGPQIKRVVCDAIYDAVYPVFNEIRDKLLESTIDTAVLGEVLDQFCWGQHDCELAAFYEFFVEQCGIELKALPGISGMTNAGWYIPYNNLILVSERPSLLKFDEHGRLHAEDGYAIQYPDNWGFCSWHGLRVPEEWILDKDNVNPRLCLTHENVEQRRALCEILGWSKVLEACNVREVQRDKYGTLLETTSIMEGRTSKFVRVTCPSTHRQYVLATFDDVQTAHEAVARSFGVQDPSDYNPVIET